MSARPLTVLAVVAGLLLILAAVTVPLWMAAPGIGDVQAAQILWDNQMANFTYAVAVLLSCVLITPVIVTLTTRLHAVRPGYAVLTGSVFLFGLVLEAAGTMASLSRWAGAITGTLSGDALWLAIYQSLTMLYLAVDFSGVALIYVAAALYVVALWPLHRPSAYALTASIALLIVGFLLPGFYSTAVLAVSISVYGLAYAALGFAAASLAASVRPSAGQQPARKPAHEQRPTRRRRR